MILVSIITVNFLGVSCIKILKQVICLFLLSSFTSRGIGSLGTTVVYWKVCCVLTGNHKSVSLFLSADNNLNNGCEVEMLLYL